MTNAVREVLDEPRWRDGAKSVANVIAGCAGATAAVSELERLTKE